METNIKIEIQELNLGTEDTDSKQPTQIKTKAEAIKSEREEYSDDDDVQVPPSKKRKREVKRIYCLEDLIPFIEQQDNSKNCTYLSDIPQICKDEPCMLGIDEAGRGPILGPMVYGIGFCPLANTEMLKDLGCADSKQLTEEKREIIFNNILTKDEILSNFGWAVEIISPNFISQNMLRRTKHSLNEVSMDSAIELVHKAIAAGVNIAEVYVDTVGPSEKYQAKLSDIFPDFNITVAKKADSTYPIVSAASICAKVTRDHSLKAWQFREGNTLTWEQFGSGYPGDPKTKAFLRENIDLMFGYPRLVRFSWATSVNALNGKAFTIEFDDSDPIEIAEKQKKSIKKFFKPSKEDEEKKPHVRHQYFQDRYLKRVTDFF